MFDLFHNIVKFEDLSLGMKLKDIDGSIGIIKEIQDIHEEVRFIVSIQNVNATKII